MEGYKNGETGRSQIMKGLRNLTEEIELYSDIYRDLLKFKQENSMIGFDFWIDHSG